jgi:hypothetical protein
MTTVGDLVNKDTDTDGILDWEESLWGTDPTLKETTPGTPDATAIEKIKAQNKDESETANSQNPDDKTPELTQTEKFARELFATTSALNQNGGIDSSTAEQIGAALADKIQNAVQRKIFSLADIKTTTDNSGESIRRYSTALNEIYTKYSDTKDVLSILQEVMTDPNNPDAEALEQLNPIILQAGEVIEKLQKITVPQTLSFLHLDLLNSSELVLENVTDLKFFITDPLVAIAAVSQFSSSANALETAASALISEIKRQSVY